LCFAFSQITRTTPRRLMTLHFTQIFFTDARTFIRYCPSPRIQSRPRFSLSSQAFSYQLSAISLILQLPKADSSTEELKADG